MPHLEGMAIREMTVEEEENISESRINQNQNIPFKFEVKIFRTKALGLLVAWYSSAALAAGHLSRVLQNVDFDRSRFAVDDGRIYFDNFQRNC
jgi:hypothetical protein